MKIQTRNRAPLAILIGQISSLAQSEPDSPFGKPAPAKHYEKAIDHLRFEAMAKNPEYGQVANKAIFVNLDNMTAEQAKQLGDAVRKADPKTDKYTDSEISESLATNGAAYAIPDSNIIVYSAAALSQYSSATAHFILAHELGHHILEGRGEKMGNEKGADHIGADIVGGQKAVNALSEMARKEPKTNDRGYSERADHNAHKTNYERAVDIRKEFPHQHIDLSHFPKSTKDKYVNKNGSDTPLKDRPPSMQPGF